MEKKLSSKTIFECDFLTFYQDEVELQNGNKSERVYIKHIGAASCLPITKEGNVILTRQWRYPLHTYSIEIPAGKKDAYDESGFDCVKRELEEETGYQSDSITPLINIHNCVGYSDEVIEIFVAKDCYKVEHPIESDEDEFIDLLIVSKEEAFEMVKSNKITDVKTIIAIQSLFLGLTDK